MIAKLINNLDRKYAFGILTGLIFGLLSVYTDFLRSNSPNIEFDVLSNTTVVDLKENIGKIDILYDSTSILSEKKNLSLITFKITNTGNADILENFYYKKFPLGFKLVRGELLEIPTIIQTNNDFLSKSIILNKVSSHEVRFNNFIFEKGDFFTIKMLVLHDIKSTPEIISEGKVIGVKNIKVIKTYINKGNKGFWENVFEGTLLVHITRFFSYFLITIIVLVLIIIPITYLSDWVGEQKRKKIIKRFKEYRRKDFSIDEQIILEFYLINGTAGIETFRGVLKRYKKYKNINKIINPDLEEKNMMRFSSTMPYQKQAYLLIDSLKKLDLIKVVDGKLEFKENIDAFIAELIEFTMAK